MKWQMKCGGSFMASTEKQYITSPGYPQKYDNNLICSYTIFGRNKIIVEFEDFALEGGNRNLKFAFFNLKCTYMKIYRYLDYLVGNNSDKQNCFSAECF